MKGIKHCLLFIKTKLRQFEEYYYFKKRKTCCCCKFFSWFHGEAGVCEMKRGRCTNRLMNCFDICDTGKFEYKRYK